MRGTVTFPGPSVVATTLLCLLGCRVLAVREIPEGTAVEVEALGSAADRVALAESDGLFEFELDAAAEAQASSGVYQPITISAVPHRPIAG